MSSVQQLHEILQNIFRIVAASNQKHLYYCALVCQSWYLPACRVLYEKLVILSRSQMITCFRLQRNNLGGFCKVLELNNGSNLKKKLSREQYDLLFSYLPNIHTVTIGYRNTWNDLNHLNRNANQIKHLKYLTIAQHTPEIIQAYYNCAFAHHQTLQHLELTRPSVFITTNSGKRGHMYTILSDFTSLTSLHIKNQAEHNAGLQQLSMFHILRLCPNLFELIWENEFQEPEINENDYQLDHSNLKDLEIVLFELTEQHVDGMVKSVTKLERLGVSIKSRQSTEKLYLT